MPEPKKHKKKVKLSKVKSSKKVLWKIYFLAIIALITSVFTITHFFFQDKSCFNVFVAGINVGGLNKEGIKKELDSNIKMPSEIELEIADKKINLSLDDLEFSYDFDQTANNSINIKKSGNQIVDLLSLPFNIYKKEKLPLEIRISENKLDEFLDVLEAEHADEPVDYTISLVNKNVVINKGRPGEYLDKESVKKEVISSLKNNSVDSIKIILHQRNETLNTDEETHLLERSQNLIGKSVILKHEHLTFNLTDKELVSFLRKNNDYRSENIYNYLNLNILPKVAREPQNASFVLEDQKVKEFTPAKDGVSLDLDNLTQNIIKSLNDLEESEDKTASIDIPVKTKKPDITLEDVNNLGINKQIGRGSSFFRGSISSRIFNIGHASAKFKSILVPPGETFSFNSVLGDVSALTGYKQAYVIKDGRTVLGDGGGVCQVSTTLFRAALNAGLPIVERSAHSYRVSYYEQASDPGLDATIYYPSTDLKFKNDTPGYLLIQSVFDPSNYSLVFEIYGTSDGRVVNISKPKTLSSSAPPEDLYVDDPSLPNGQIKQIDYKAWGARVSFNYKVERNGEVLFEKTFLSNYRPWQSVYLRGTGPTI